MKKTFKFDSEWSIAISLLPEEQQQLLTEAIKEYQSCDKMPDNLDPASMMGFLMAKAVIDRRKRANMRARERRALRRAQSAPLSVQSAPDETPATAVSLPAENAVPPAPRYSPVGVTRFFSGGRTLDSAARHRAQPHAGQRLYAASVQRVGPDTQSGHRGGVQACKPPHTAPTPGQ